MTTHRWATLKLHAFALASAALLAGTAAAQSPPVPPTDYQLDVNGVDLVTGEFSFNRGPELSIGPDGPQGLSWSTTSTLDLLNNWWTGWGVDPATGADQVIIGHQTDLLMSGASLTGSDAHLQQAVAPAPTNLTAYVTREGVQYVFDPSLLTYVHGSASTIYYPSGQIVSLQYETAQGTSRLRSVTNNSGYAFRIGYALETLPSPGDLAGAANWVTVASVTALNTTQCGVNDACAQSGSWPSITYNLVGQTSYLNCPTGCYRTATDAQGRTWRYTYDTYNRLVGVRLPGHSSDSITVTYYDGTPPSVHTVTNERGTTTYTGSVDSNDKYATIIVTDASGVNTSAVTPVPLGPDSLPGYGVGKIVRTVNALGLPTNYSYDSANRLLRVTKPEGNYVEFTYDGRGNITQTRQVSKTPTTDPDLITKANFDASCTNLVTCNQPHWTVDIYGAETDYT